MPKIAISYRRADTEVMAGRIRDRLANRYGEDAVFMDIDNITFWIEGPVPKPGPVARLPQHVEFS